ncbi:unnamed protein product [Closterium sp. Naga37s-1]|nr:unnamed protein product [Closterium sp. Naga37s-1]
MEFPRPARPVILAILLLSLAAHSHTQTTYDEFLDKIESVLNGSTPVGKVDSILFTQANRYNLARSNKARAKSASQGGGKSVSHRYPFRSNSHRSSVASDPGVDSSSGNTGGSASGSSGSSFGLISRFFSSFFSVRSSATTSGFTKPAPPLSTFQNGVKWLSSSAAASKSNRAKLNFLLKLLGQPSLNEALGDKKSAFFIPADANVTLEAEGVTNLTAAQATVPNTVPTTPAPVSGQSYGQSYAMMSSGTVGVLHDDDDDERRSRGGRQYRIECHDDEEDDDEEECIEPVGKVRIIKYT